MAGKTDANAVMKAATAFRPEFKNCNEISGPDGDITCNSREDCHWDNGRCTSVEYFSNVSPYDNKTQYSYINVTPQTNLSGFNTITAIIAGFITFLLLLCLYKTLKKRLL